MKRGLKGGISIDADSGPLDVYFDAVVAEIENNLLLFRLALAILCIPSSNKCAKLINFFFPLG